MLNADLQNIEMQRFWDRLTITLCDDLILHHSDLTVQGQEYIHWNVFTLYNSRDQKTKEST